MITLDYRKINARWGLRGIYFHAWTGYAFTLGYLSNIAHYKRGPRPASGADIAVIIERNNDQGAWDREGRLLYYGALTRLQTHFPDLFRCSSAGVGRVTRRINSNNYILSLLNDYGFTLQRRPNGQLTADLFPSAGASVQIWPRLQRHLQSLELSQADITACYQEFDRGFRF